MECGKKNGLVIKYTRRKTIPSKITKQMYEILSFFDFDWLPTDLLYDLSTFC